MAGVTLTLDSRTIPVPPLPATISNGSQQLNCSSLTPRLAATSHQPLYLRGRAPGTHCIGDWVDPSTGLNDMEK
jgi:hypothetical protein